MNTRCPVLIKNIVYVTGIKFTLYVQFLKKSLVKIDYTRYFYPDLHGIKKKSGQAHAIVFKCEVSGFVREADPVINNAWKNHFMILI